MLDASPIPADEAETNLPSGEPGDGGDGAVSVVRVDEHFKRLEETRGDRQKIGWAYRALAATAFAEWKRLDNAHAAAEADVRALIDRYWREWEEDELERAGRVVGAENAATRLAKAKELALERRDRYAKAAEEVTRCSAGLMVGRASDCALACTSHGVAGCNRICCPLCAPRRAAVEVGTYAPVIADLLQCEVWMLSMRNVAEGELDAGQRRILKASQKLRRSKWFVARKDSGIQALEVTAGRAPGERAKGRFSGWHPHLHMIVGNLNERETPDGEWADRDVGRRKTDLETQWGRSLGVIQHRSGCEARFHSADCSRWRPDRPELGSRTLACGECEAVGELPENVRSCECGAYRPIVWVDRPHFLERRHGEPRKVYADDLDDEHDRRKAFESSARECLKYIVKGVSEIPRRMLPELIQAKERRRWMQSFGGLHEQGMLACVTCQRRWRKKEHGEKCPRCAAAGVSPKKLVEDPPWCCSHGFDLRIDGYVAPPREEWAALNPSGLLTRRRRAHKTGPPEHPRLGGKR